MLCLFCQSEGPFTVEHVIPESLGNDDLILVDQVCMGCNSHFSKIEEFVLQKTPLAFWRAYLGIKTKKGKFPAINMSLVQSDSNGLVNSHDTVISATYGRSFSLRKENPAILESCELTRTA